IRKRRTVRASRLCANYFSMDKWTWTLSCQSCRETFELTLQPGERIIEYARKAPCPHCNTKPAEAKGSPTLWHHIIAFRAMTPELGHGHRKLRRFARVSKWT